MATSKTLTPTNVTIQIPAMADLPDASVFSNCVDKLGDAVNALNSKLTGYSIYNIGTINFPTGFTIPSNSRHLLIINGPYYSRGRAVIIVSANTSGAVYAIKVGGDENVSIATDTNTLTLSDSNGSTVTAYASVLTSFGSNITI